MAGDILQFEDESGIDRLVGTLHDPAATTGDVLTVQADKSIAAQAGGGGSGGVQTVTVPVSSAQILDLFNTPVMLIAGVAGQVTILVAIDIAYVPGLIPYLDGGGNLQVNPSNWQAFATAGFWDQAIGKFWAPGFMTGPAVVDSSSLDGVDVELIATVASPTLGDGTLLVTLSYFLAPTV